MHVNQERDEFGGLLFNLNFYVRECKIWNMSLSYFYFTLYFFFIFTFTRFGFSHVFLYCSFIHSYKSCLQSFFFSLSHSLPLALTGACNIAELYSLGRLLNPCLLSLFLILMMAWKPKIRVWIYLNNTHRSAATRFLQPLFLQKIKRILKNKIQNI